MFRSATGKAMNCDTFIFTPGEGTDYPLKYSCLENSMDRVAWQAIVHGVAQSQTRLRAFTFTFIFTLCSSLKTQPSLVSWQPWYMVLGAVMTSLHSLHPWHCNHLPILSNQIQILLLLAIVDSSVQFSSVTQSCPALCKCLDCSPPGSSVQHYSR